MSSRISKARHKNQMNFIFQDMGYSHQDDEISLSNNNTESQDRQDATTKRDGASPWGDEHATQHQGDTTRASLASQA